MLAHLFSATTVAKAAVVLSLATGTAVASYDDLEHRAVVAPVAATPTPGNVETLARECVERYLALRQQTAPQTNAEGVSALCKRAIEASGLSAAEFWAKYGPQPTRKPEQGADARRLARECIERYLAIRGREASAQVREDVSALCTRAIEMSGLTSNEFWALYGPAPATAPRQTRKPEPTAKPATNIEALARDCVDLYSALRRDSTDEARTLVSGLCRKAVELTGLGTGDLFAKYKSH